MIQSLIGAFGARVPISFLMSKVQPVSLFRIGLATPSSSALQVILCLIYMYKVAIPQERRKAQIDQKTLNQ